MTLLFFSDIPWSALHQRPQHLASRFAREWRVLWIEPATLGAKASWTPVEKANNLYLLSLPQFPHNARSRAIRVASRVISRFLPARWLLTLVQGLLLKRALRRVNVPVMDTTAFVQNFQFIRLVESMHPRRMVFDYIDDAFGFTDFPRYVHKEWSDAVGSADAISTTSPVLREQIVRLGRNDVQVVNNGVDYAFFATSVESAQRPVDLPAGEQIVMYTGSVYPWFDFDLMEHLLSTFQKLQFVIIGNEHPEVRANLRHLERFPHFHLLGVRAYNQIPAYLAYAHAGIIPFRKTTLTAAVNPVKLYEYCAAGVPTVTTDFAGELSVLGVPLFVSSSHEQFAMNLGEAVKRSADASFTDQLRAFARSNDWDQRTRDISALLRPPGKTP
ncbi:MAG: glycosyltransferase [Ignavibacteria bacterium]|nr:glycosyltransferase [Ignavibacteria bacterium]